MNANEHRLILLAFDLGIEFAQLETAEIHIGSDATAERASKARERVRADLIRLLDAMTDETV